MAFDSEAQVYEAMGLTPPEEAPAEETTVEETPVEETPTEEPATQEQVETPEGGDGVEDPLEKLRRELTEQHQAELEQLRQQHRTELDQIVEGIGLKNPYDGSKPIKTKADLDAYKTAFEDAKWDNIARQTGMTPEELEQLIQQRPEVRKGLEAQAAAQAAQEEAEQRQLQARLDADIAAIAAECPEVTDIESLVNHPSYAAVAAKMNQLPGLGVADAFFLVNRTALAAGRASADAQRVRNNLAGKNHMVPGGSRGGGAPNLSREQEAMYRALNPNASRAEILKFHQENMKGESK